MLRLVPLLPALSTLATALATGDSSSSPHYFTADDSTGVIGLMWAVIILFRIIAASSAKDERVRPPGYTPPPPPRPVEPGYAVPCPICGERDLQEAREIGVVHGRGLRPIVTTHVVAGCTPCVRTASAKLMRSNFRTGFLSLGGLVATPLTIALDAQRIYGASSTALIEKLVRNAGLEPDDVRLNAHGITRPQQRMVNAAAAIFAPIVWAHGSPAVKTHQRAARAIRRLTHDRLAADRATLLLNAARYDQPKPSDLTRALKGTLFRMLRDIAIAEGPLSRRKLELVYAAAVWLGHSKKDVDALLGAFATPEPDPTGGGPRYKYRYRTHDHERENAEREARNRWRDSNRYSAPLQDNLALARAVLGVSATASYTEIQTAYRILIARSHPDRAGSDPKEQAERTRRTQELTWAMAALRRAATRPMS